MTALPPSVARAWVDVDLSALLANARALAAHARRSLLPMVKANGYGLGAVAVARALEAVAPWGYGVATLEEGEALRQAGIRRPVLVFTPMQPVQVPALRALDLRPVVGDDAALAAWLAAGDAPFHLEIDSGMGRSGFAWDDAAGLAAAAGRLALATGWEGVFTHFHSTERAPQTMREQGARFEQALARLGRRPALVHTANSAGAFTEPAAPGDLVRSGIFLYGGATLGPASAPVHPRPVARLQARVVAVRRVAPGATVGYDATWTATRPATIATLSIGYADGVLRSLGNRGVVELEGHVLPIVGRVSMDLTTVAVPDAVPVAPGAVATVWGGRVTLEAQALAAGTIAYELLTALGPRVERRHHGGAA